MDSSFLTFSPRVLPKKGVLRRKPLKQKHQQLCSSTSRMYNKKRNSRESGSKFEINKDVAHDEEDIIFICEKKSNIKKSQSSPGTDWLTSSDNLFDKKLATLSSKQVRSTEYHLAEDEKFQEIQNWLDKIRRADKRNRFTVASLTPPYCSSSSIVHSSNPKASKQKATSCVIIPETSSDESRVSQEEVKLDWLTSSDNLFDKKLATLSSKQVRSTEYNLAEDEKSREIQNWLDKIRRADKMNRFTVASLTPPYCSSSSIVHSSNPKVSNQKATSCLIIPDTSSDESRVSQEEVKLDGTGPVTKSEDTNLNGSKSERNKSSDGSDRFKSRKKIPIHREGSVSTISETSCSVSTKSQKEVESGKGKAKAKGPKGKSGLPLTKHDEKNLNWRNSADVVGSGSSSDGNSGSQTSLKLLRSKRKGLVYSDDESSQGSDRAGRCVSGRVSENSNESSEEGSLRGNYKRCSEEGTNTSSSCDESVSSSSDKSLLRETYGKAVDVKEVLTPKMKRRIALVKNSLPEGDLAEKLLSNLYGNNWNKTEVLSPIVNKNVTRKDEGKENSPPGSGEKPDTFENLTPNTHLEGVKLKSLRSQDLLSFLRSLSASPSPSKCDPKALLFKTEFKTKKLELCSELFNLFNAEVFENKLPSTLSITWNKRMYRTAGYCRETWTLGPNGKIRTARVELSPKVCTTADRVRDTLIHELCHAASWVVSGVRCMHGPVWQSWAQKAMRRFPELPPITRCHDYKIETKFIYKCTQCGYSLGRHSKSLDLQRKRCGYCYGKFEVLINSKPRKADAGLPTTPRTPRPVSGFALYVRENYKVVKEKNSGLKHGEIMRIMGSEFSKMKLAP